MDGPGGAGALARLLPGRKFRFSGRLTCAVLAEYQVHYNTARPHQGTARRVPDGEHLTVTDRDRGGIHRKPVLGGLINEYSLAA